ncbi:helix-turn-helix domain-containing protein [Pseudomonas sp. URMO17WK12:I11]|uniref:helix-turn-helix domain-containing protein n=1 Tax=Pseudomonas sp. URMO17WK12:I11 TaxID=1283291 RepID=UPI00071EBE7D|nr:XRE family transcriptional regulator [Pseudomonas sp. URMO17WK12:I11]CRL49843.1 helix-turn-helix protein [Pseudomonas sp. URMO17WK12:I11]
MIYNERQYLSSSKQLESLSTALANFQPSGVDWLDAAQTKAIESQIKEIRSEIREYELIKEGKVSYSECSGLSELPKTLITARIASGMNQKDLAERMGLPVQQVQRYEASNYMTASLARLISVAEILGVKTKESWVGAKASSADSVFSWSSPDNIDWGMFPANEMIKRGWISNSPGSGKTDLVRSYFLGNGGQNAPVLHRKKFHGENRPNEYSLLAWQARVLEKARTEVDLGHVNEYEHTDVWLADLARLTCRNDAPRLAKDFLASRGIVLVIERHLSGTYLDGAAMILETGHPVVAMTIRHDRLDNFWFVLFHELAHIALHLFDSLQMDFFDEESKSEGDTIEKEADEFALEALISNSLWDSCLSRFTMTTESILQDAERLAIHPSILAGRIRKESGNYSIFSDLLGQGKVRVCFEETT